jgi:hypothetical protein
MYVVNHHPSKDVLCYRYGRPDRVVLRVYVLIYSKYLLLKNGHAYIRNGSNQSFEDYNGILIFLITMRNTQ